MDHPTPSSDPDSSVDQYESKSRRRQVIREEAEVDADDIAIAERVENQIDHHAGQLKASPLPNSIVAVASEEVIVISDDEDLEDPAKDSVDEDEDPSEEESENAELSSYLQKKKQFGKGILKKVAKKQSRLRKQSQASSTAASSEDASSSNPAVAALRHQLQVERELHTGWIPSLSAINASTLDARERMYAALSRLSEPSDSSGRAAAESHEYARRRQTQDSFLESLAAKYAKPVKGKTTKPKKSSSSSESAASKGAKRKKSEQAADKSKEGEVEGSSVAAASNSNIVAFSSTDLDTCDSNRESSQPKKKKLKSKTTSTGATTAVNAAVPDDMEFLLLQEKLGWDKKLSKK